MNTITWAQQPPAIPDVDSMTGEPLISLMVPFDLKCFSSASKIVLLNSCYFKRIFLLEQMLFLRFSNFLFGRRQQRMLGGLVIFILVISTRYIFSNTHDIQKEFSVQTTIGKNSTTYSDSEQNMHSFVEQSEADHQDGKSSEQTYILQAASDIRNLPEPPFILGGQANGPNYLKKKNCARFPTLYDIQFNNVYWQVEKIANLTFYFFSAHYDNRNISTGKSLNYPSIRILAMVDQRQINGSAICQLWFKDESSPVIASVQDFKSVWQGHWSKLGVYNPFLITCKIPKTHLRKVPVSVSIVEQKCTNATNNIRIHYNMLSDDNDLQKHGQFGVCVKGLDMLDDDKSIRLIEWIELLSILGADKIFFYEFTVHPNVKKVLDYYVTQGKADVTPLTLPGNLPNDPRLRHLFLGKKSRRFDKRKNEVIPYNDCLYRNLNNYRYLAVLDTDEVILPKSDLYWNEFMKNYESEHGSSINSTSSWCFRNVYFLDEMTEDQEGDGADGIPKYMHMLKNVYRSANYTPPKSFIKCFHGTERTLTVHNHFPFSCLAGNCKVHHIDTNVAHMQHYRSHCVDDIKDCKGYKRDSVLDTTVWKYKDELVRRVGQAMTHLDITARHSSVYNN